MLFISGFTAGFFYYAAMIMAGGTIYGNSPPVDVYISMGCHGILYLCGFVKLKTCVYTSNDYPKLLGGTACIVLHAHLLRPLTNPSARLFIYALLDGTYVKAFFSESLLGKILPVYYIGIVCLLLLWIRVFFILNRMEFRKYMKQGASVEALSGS